MKEHFCDHALVRSPGTYGCSIRKLIDGGVRRLGSAGKHTVGLSFVSKKSGRQRLVMDTRLLTWPSGSRITRIFHPSRLGLSLTAAFQMFLLDLVA